MSRDKARVGEGSNSLHITTFRSGNRMANILPIGIIVQIIGVYVVVHLPVTVMIKNGAGGSVDG